MEQKKISGFYEELGKLLERYGIDGMCGMCFEPDTLFLAVIYDPTDTELGGYVEKVRAAIAPVLKEITGAPGTKDQVRGLTGNAENN